MSCNVGKTTEGLKNELWHVGEVTKRLENELRAEQRMSSNVGKATEGLKNELWHVGEVTKRLENELCYDYNFELCSFSNLSVTSPTSQLILQSFRRFTYIAAHSTLPLLHLRHSSFSTHSFAFLTSQALHVRHLASRPWIDLFVRKELGTLTLCSFPNLSVTSPTSKLNRQSLRRFTYVTAHSPTLPLLRLRHSSFSDPSFASLTSQALHLRHLASHPWVYHTSCATFLYF